MPQYQLTLKIPDIDTPCLHEIDLLPSQEDRPEKFFTSQVQEAIRTNLQRQSLCSINDTHLNRIIRRWIDDIREGYRASSISLDLPLLVDANITQINDSGIHDLPPLILPNLLDIEPTGGELPPLIFA
jgi:hypothetical protein